MTRRLFRGLLIALLIGFVGFVMSFIPALFIQSVFIGSEQRCKDLRDFEQAAYERVRTDCAENLTELPTWLPGVILAGGAAMGSCGGFAYGFINPARQLGRGRAQERPWLPF